MVLLAVGGTASAVKISQQDAQRIEQHTGASVEELEDQELTSAMQALGIQSAALTPQDKAALSAAPAVEDGEPAVPEPAAKQIAYIEELQKLAGLRDQGIITDEEFEAKKKQLLGL